MRSVQSAAASGAAPRIVSLDPITDARGTLAAADSDALPFSPVRYFVIHDVPQEAIRARHALRQGQELLSCVSGSCTVEVRWQSGHAVHRLAGPATALHLPPWVWVECREFSGDAVLLVLCSLPYDPLDQITDFGEFEAGPPARA